MKSMKELQEIILLQLINLKMKNKYYHEKTHIQTIKLEKTNSASI